MGSISSYVLKMWDIINVIFLIFLKKNLLIFFRIFIEVGRCILCQEKYTAYASYVVLTFSFHESVLFNLYNYVPFTVHVFSVISLNFIFRFLYGMVHVL